MPKLDGLSPKQEKFAKAYLDTGNATQSIKQAGYNVKNDNVAKSMGNENLSKPDIMAFLKSKAQECASIIYELAQTAENETVRLNAAKDVMDRSGFKPTEKIDHTTKGERINGIEYLTPDGKDKTETTT